MDTHTIKFKSFEVHQPIGTFYVGVISHSDLIRLSHTDVRRLESQEREIETYIGIQRPLSPARVREIGKYVNLIDASFPNSVILHAKEEDVKFDIGKSEMTVSDRPDVFKVLDGQHRIAGLQDYKGDNFLMNITLFVGMELEDQAIIFATINKSQTKVNKSLVADLFEFADSRSPQKTAHNIARALNEKEGSPFYGKIKILGTATEPEKETITQATFVDALLDYITRDPMTDRDLYKRGKTPSPATGAAADRLFLRNLFLQERDSEIAQLLWNYFSSVSERWPIAWRQVRKDSVLNKSTGFVALMKFLKDTYLSFEKTDSVVSKREFASIFERIRITDDEFTKQNYLPGGVGVSTLYKQLKDQAGI